MIRNGSTVFLESLYGLFWQAIEHRLKGQNSFRQVTEALLILSDDAKKPGMDIELTRDAPSLICPHRNLDSVSSA